MLTEKSTQANYISNENEVSLLSITVHNLLCVIPILCLYVCMIGQVKEANLTNNPNPFPS
jgi:hypothetical protein